MVLRMVVPCLLEIEMVLRMVVTCLLEIEMVLRMVVIHFSISFLHSAVNTKLLSGEII